VSETIERVILQFFDKLSLEDTEEDAAGTSTSSSFNKLFEINWKPVDDSSKLSGFKFTENKCGIKEEIMETFINKEPYDYMKLLITDDIINHIVLETNRYAAQSMEKEKKQNLEFTHGKTQIKKKLKCFWVLLWMGLCRYPKISEYWSQNKIYPHNFRQYMSRNRFEISLRMLHFSDSNGDLQPIDRMRKISPLVTQLRERFQSVIIPEDVCIDEKINLLAAVG
jgi:hypothetical protein